MDGKPKGKDKDQDAVSEQIQIIYKSLIKNKDPLKSKLINAEEAHHIKNLPRYNSK